MRGIKTDNKELSVFAFDLADQNATTSDPELERTLLCQAAASAPRNRGLSPSSRVAEPPAPPGPCLSVSISVRGSIQSIPERIHASYLRSSAVLPAERGQNTGSTAEGRSWGARIRTAGSALVKSRRYEAGDASGPARFNALPSLQATRAAAYASQRGRREAPAPLGHHDREAAEAGNAGPSRIGLGRSPGTCPDA